MDRPVLALVTLHSDLTDGIGNVYPADGFVKAPNFNPDEDILSGLHGVLWGRTNSEEYLLHSTDSVWVVVKISRDEKIIVLDGQNNVIKFETALICYSGNREGASSFIAEEVRKLGEFSVTEIAGYVDEADTPNRSAFAQGHSGRAVSNVATLHAIAMARQAKALATQMESYAIAFGAGGEAATIDDASVALAAGSDCVAKSTGESSAAITLTPFSRAFCMGPGGVAVCVAPGGTAATGPNGALVMAYRNRTDQVRYAVAYVGDGILPNRMYTCEEPGVFVLVK